jgi:hypothetical protein
MAKKKKETKKKTTRREDSEESLPLFSETELEPSPYNTRAGGDPIKGDFEALLMPQEQQHDITAVSKEMFNAKDMDIKTELSDDEIKLLVRVRFLETKFQITNMQDAISNFFRMRASLKRQSRGEFVDVSQAERKSREGGNWLSKVFGNGNQGGQQ